MSLLFVLHIYMSVYIGNDDIDVTNITIPAVLLSQVRVVNPIMCIYIMCVLLTCRVWEGYCRVSLPQLMLNPLAQ